jgi:hypothetical protein
MQVSLLMIASAVRGCACLLGDQGRQLVAQGLAGTRGHAQKRVLALETRPNHLQLHIMKEKEKLSTETRTRTRTRTRTAYLERAEGGVAEVGLQALVVAFLLSRRESSHAAGDGHLPGRLGKGRRGTRPQ